MTIDASLIDGVWSAGAGSGRIELVNPATEESLGSVTPASVEQVDAAVDAARRTFDEGSWARLPPHERSMLLHRLADAFEERFERYVDLIVEEVGATVELTRRLQVGGPLNLLRWFADAAARGPRGGHEESLPIHEDPVMSSSILRREPAGVVAAITAYNYPLLLLVRKLGGALAAGCTVVVMPSARTPIVTIEFLKMMEEAGLPPGVVNLVVGEKEVGERLTLHHGVDLVSFTGSLSVGRQVMAQAALDVKRVVLELGGKSPTIVLPGADISRSIPSSIMRFCTNAGQGCGATTRIFVPREDYPGYLEQATAFIESLGVGDPRDERNVVGPLIRAEQRDIVEGYVARALAAGGTIEAGGGRPDLPRGYYMNPALVSNVSNTSEISQEELFGPVAVVVPYDTVEEAIRLANETRYSINAQVWGPTPLAMRAARELRAGTVSLNGGGGTRHDVPWGGYGSSGIGREEGEEGFLEFFEVKHIQWPL